MFIVALLAGMFSCQHASAQYTTDSSFLVGSRPVVFKVNTYILSPADQKWIVDSLMPQLQAIGPHGVILGRSAASPEGTLTRNHVLAEGRSRAVVDFLISHGFDASRIHFDVFDEEYPLLVEMMRQNHDADYERVRDIVHEGKGDLAKIKLTLRLLDGGKLWYRLLYQYYPHLRAVRIMAFDFDFSIPKPMDLKVAPVVCPYQIVIPRIQPKLVIPDWMLQPAPAPVPAPAPDSLLIRPELLALRTNMLYDAWYQPQFGWAPGMNVQLEYFPLSGHITYNAGFTFHNHRHWDSYQFFQIRDIDLEARWYFCPSGVFMGPYAGIDVHGSWYGIGFSKTKGWEGEGGGAGITLGWTHYLTSNRRWRIEANVGFGYFATKYDPYVYGNTLTGEEDGKYYYDYYGAVSQFRKRNHMLSWFGPTQAGIHLTYVLLYRRLQRRGAGFRRTELYDPSSSRISLQKGEPR